MSIAPGRGSFEDKQRYEMELRTSESIEWFRINSRKEKIKKILDANKYSRQEKKS